MGETEKESIVIEELPSAVLEFYSPTEFENSFPKLCVQSKRKMSSPKCDSQAKKSMSNLNEPYIEKAVNAPK